jgi:hypothetical protein
MEEEKTPAFPKTVSALPAGPTYSTGTEEEEWVKKVHDRNYDAVVERVLVSSGGVRLELPAAHHSALHARANSRSPGPHRKANADAGAGKQEASDR